MSRIGRKTVPLPQGVTAQVNGQEVKVKGPKGELSLRLIEGINASVDKDGVTVKPRDTTEAGRAIWGLQRTLVNNLVQETLEHQTVQRNDGKGGIVLAERDSVALGNFANQIRYVDRKLGHWGYCNASLSN